jgi:hypothetical protein
VLRSSLFLLLEMLLPSLLVLSGLGWIDLLLRTFSPSHPAHVETCALPNDEHALYKWYFQASLSYPRSSLDQSKRARVYEHRHPENAIDPVCAFREHKD